MNTQKNFLSNPVVVLFGALICCALWGSAFPCIKYDAHCIFRYGKPDFICGLPLYACRNPRSCSWQSDTAAVSASDKSLSAAYSGTEPVTDHFTIPVFLYRTGTHNGC